MNNQLANKLTKNQVKEALWRRANLSWLLDNNQKSLYELFHNNPEKIQSWLLARRSGKTHSLCVLAIEYCLKHPGAIIKYVAPTNKQVERFIRPIIAQILESCPEDIKPEYRGKDTTYFFPNRSEIQLCGAEKDNADSIRGGFSHIAIVDEAQDFSKLKDVVNSILLPTTLTTGGKILISGTPPKNADHEFIYFIEMCNTNGTLIKRTVYDNPRLDKKELDLIIKALNGTDSEEFRREFMCEIFKSTNNNVIPEFDKNKMEEIVKEWEKPAFYSSYVGMDIGGRDWTVVLFAYFDVRQDKLIFEDELVYKGGNMFTPNVARDILLKESELWTNPLTHEQIKPKKRVSDHNTIFINDIKKHSNYQVIFENAEKSDKQAAINFFRVLINSNKIVINPKCKTLIDHLMNAKWANPNTPVDYARCPNGSHYDAVDAAIYLTRAVDFRFNPFPKDYNSPLRKEDAFFTKEYSVTSKPVEKEALYRKMVGSKQNTDHIIETENNRLIYKNILRKK